MSSLLYREEKPVAPIHPASGPSGRTKHSPKSDTEKRFPYVFCQNIVVKEFATTFEIAGPVPRTKKINYSKNIAPK